MALSVTSDLSDILDNDEARAILDKHGVPSGDPQMPLAAGMGMTLEDILTYPGHEYPQEVYDGIAKDLEEANIG
jgi:hypothetical protein